MAINIDRASETSENGYAITDNDGNVLFYLAVGNGDPVGSPAPINTWFFRQDSQLLYYKFGAGNNDWRQMRAEDIYALDQNSNPTTVQAILSAVAGGGGSGVSQTAIFGDGGNTSQNSYLPNQGVPSNVVGVPVGINNAKIRNVFLGNLNTKTGNLLIQERFPAGTGTWTTIYTLSLTAEAFKKVGNLAVSVTTDAEVAVFTEVALKSVKCVLNINGDSAT